MLINQNAGKKWQCHSFVVSVCWVQLVSYDWILPFTEFIEMS